MVSNQLLCESFLIVEKTFKKCLSWKNVFIIWSIKNDIFFSLNWPLRVSVGAQVHFILVKIIYLTRTLSPGNTLSDNRYIV